VALQEVVDEARQLGDVQAVVQERSHGVELALRDVVGDALGIGDRVQPIVTVTDDERGRPMAFLFERLKLVVEPSGAVPLAAALANPQRFRGRRVGIILSGGNVDPATAGQWFSSSHHAA